MSRIARLPPIVVLFAVLLPGLIAGPNSALVSPLGSRLVPEPFWSFLALGRSGVLLAQERPPKRFETDVRPILKAHCWQCHGEAGVLKGGLDLRQARRILRGGEAGQGLVAGQPDESLLLQRVVDGEMPPGDKKLGPGEIAVLREWIVQGALTARPEPEDLSEKEAFTEEERNFWAFRPVLAPGVPVVQHPELARTAIDRFLLARLEPLGLQFSPEADRATLARRITFDLTGLPPTPESLESFLADESPDAYERMVEGLLASPRYGERWGRHWLDAAGYADSDGYSARDLERKYAWRYRDYVIQSFNSDLPWNQFLIEQLAGDELLVPPYKNLPPVDAQKLIATGFLRMAPDGTGDGEVEPVAARNDVLAETIKVVSTSILGLTVGCAQCHDHRYDPISQADYYRLRAIFEPAFDVANWRNPQARLVSLWHDEEYARAADVDRQQQQLTEERLKVLDGIVAEVFERELLKVPEERRELARQARVSPADKRSPEQMQILKDFPPLNVDRGSVYLYEQQRIADHNKKYDEQAAGLNSQRPAENFAQCLTEIPGQLPATRLFARGDPNQPRQEVAPGEPTVLCGTEDGVVPAKSAELPTSGRRLAWARHLTARGHPLTARVAVNRIWMHHFGAGLVTTAGDFGFLGGRPSHPELLDWLASRFVQEGWSVKRLHREMVLSAAYRQSSVRRPKLELVDPENRLLGRANVRRLEAEAVRDAVLAISGKLSNRLLGPPVPVAPDEVGQIVVAVDTRDSAGRPTGKTVALGEDEFRRSLYVQVRRSMPLSVLETFDAPDMRPNCTQRGSSTVSPQALLLMNNDFLLLQAEQLARQVQSPGGEVEHQVRRAWIRACGREPTVQRISAAGEFLKEQTRLYAETPTTGEHAASAPDPALRALANYCQALLCSNRVLYVE